MTATASGRRCPLDGYALHYAVLERLWYCCGPDDGDPVTPDPFVSISDPHSPGHDPFTAEDLDRMETPVTQMKFTMPGRIEAEDDEKSAVGAARMPIVSFLDCPDSTDLRRDVRAAVRRAAAAGDRVERITRDATGTGNGQSYMGAAPADVLGAAADWLEDVARQLDAGMNANLLLSTAHLGEHVRNNGLDPDTHTGAVFAYAWYLLTDAMRNAPEPLRMAPHELCATDRGADALVIVVIAVVQARMVEDPSKVPAPDPATGPAVIGRLMERLGTDLMARVMTAQADAAGIHDEDEDGAL